MPYQVLVDAVVNQLVQFVLLVVHVDYVLWRLFIIYEAGGLEQRLLIELQNFAIDVVQLRNSIF